ncbi:MAG: S1C family serine protease [Acidimicrobiales bacterium]
MSVLEEISSVITAAADRVGPSVVAVNRLGTGFVIDEGSVVTNAHNLRDAETRVTFADGRVETATAVGVDVDGDLAVVSVNTGQAPAIEWSEETPTLGTFVVALSNARGRGLRATSGTVSSVDRSFRGPRGRRISGSLEHTAPLARGSSGGPVLDRDGRVVGINTHRLQEGFYLALAIGDDLRQRIAALSEGKVPSRRRLGVAIIPPQAARHLREAAGLDHVEGLLVRGVEEAGPGARAGLRRGDVITAIGGRETKSIDDLHAALDTDADELVVNLVRATEEQSATVRFDDPA